MSWEDVALVIMGPAVEQDQRHRRPHRPGRTRARRRHLQQGRPVGADRRPARRRPGRCGRSTRKRIAHAEQTWWWDPLRGIARRRPDRHAVEAAARLAGHFMATIGGDRRDPFFHAAGEQVLTATLLAAAISGGTMRDVLAWLQPGRRDAITALDHAGAGTEAADLEATLSGADVTTKGIFQTARTATKALTSERILRWITPPDTWRDPPDTAAAPTELDLWDLLAAAANGRATVHLLSKEGAGTAAPVVAALVDRILEIAELLAQARGGRLEPPVVAVLDEAANICPIRALPQLYSHYGSRGIQVLTMLQSYQQGVGVWGEQGMQALWSAATIKLVGAGVDDHAFLQRLSGLIGDHYVERISTSLDRDRGASRQYSTAREPVLPASALRALPRDHAVLLATGRRAGLGQLHPWYRERDHTDISNYADTALAELRARRRRTPSAPTTPSTTHAAATCETGRPDDRPPPTRPTTRPQRLIAELLARVEALEAWRTHQSDLLDELINGIPTARPPTEPTTAGSRQRRPDELDVDAPHRLGARHVTAVIARPLRGELTWCPLWWEHPEAVFRFEALRRAWTELAPEPGAAMSIWIRDHLDPCLRELLTPLGPFADCTHNERYRSLNEHTPLPTLPTTPPDPTTADARARRRRRRRRARPPPLLIPLLLIARPPRQPSPPPNPPDAAGRTPPQIPPLAARAARHHHRAHQQRLPRTPTGLGHRPRPGRVQLEPGRVQQRPQRRRRRPLPAQPGQLARRRRPPWTDHTTAADADVLQPGATPPPRDPLGLRATCAPPPPTSRATGKPTTALDAHAGLPHRRLRPRHRLGHRHPHRRRSRLRHAPAPHLITGYIARVHATRRRSTAPRQDRVAIADLPPPAAVHRRQRSAAPTPTPPAAGCLTPATRHAHDEITRAFGPPGPAPRSAPPPAGTHTPGTPAATTPTAAPATYFPTTAGQLPHTARNSPTAGASPPGSAPTPPRCTSSYVIWQGRIWSPNTPDTDGWGRPYTGGGIYDPPDPTGGH